MAANSLKFTQRGGGKYNYSSWRSHLKNNKLTNEHHYPRLAWAITAVALLIRLFHISTHSYWLDESAEILRAMTAWPELFFLTQGPDPPGYRLLLALFVPLSRAEWVLRLPSALLSSGAVYLMYHWLAAGLKLPRLGLVAAGLLAIMPVSIFYAQETSQYSLVIFMALALNITFTQVAANGKWPAWLNLIGVTIVALFTYYGLLWLILVWDGWLAWTTWRQRNRTRWLGFVTYHVVLLAELGFLYQFFIRTQVGGVIRERPFLHLPLPQILSQFWPQTSGGIFYFQFFPFSHTIPAIFMSLCYLLLLGGLLWWWRQQPEQRHLLGVAGLVLLTFYIASGYGFYRYGLRYGLPLLPFLVLWVAAALCALFVKNRVAGTAVGATFTLVLLFFWPNLPMLPNPWLQLPREEIRPAIAYIHQQAQPDDVIYVYYASVGPYSVYEPEPIYPSVLSPWYRAWPLADKIAHIEENVGDAPRFWFLLSHISVGEDEAILQGLNQLSPPYQVIDRYDDQNAAAILLERDDS